MENMQKLLDIMARLRHPVDGCPWDRRQTFKSIVPYTIEEAYEVAEAIEQDDLDELRAELGDLLFQVVFYAQMAKEQGAFDFDDVVDGIVAKMQRRHPHVFGAAQINSVEAQSAHWEALKAEERRTKAERQQRGHSVLDGVSTALPALTRGAKLQKRAARVGFDWRNIDEIVDKAEEELEEVRVEIKSGDRDKLMDEIGDVLFVGVNLARFADIDAEAALRSANRKFERRFRRMEELLAAQGRTCTDANIDELERLWQQAKAEERAAETSM